MAEVPREIEPEEQLARDVSSREAMDRVGRGRRIFREFLPPLGDDKVSVDRITHAGDATAAALAAARATVANRIFFGWLIVAAERAAGGGRRRVVPSPIAEPANPYHADIVLPTTNRDRQKEHAQELAEEAIWRERPATESPP